MSGLGIIGWAILAVVVAVGLIISGFVYLAVVLAWEEERTKGTAYYGRPLAERRRFHGLLRVHARLLSPVIRLGARLTRVTLPKASFHYEGIAGPKGSCSAESFARGHAYEPRPEDVFVVTQMKCGTTWMQHVAYQVLTRGRGDLAERGQALYAVAPWLEGLKSVALKDAPLLGEERPSRIIKTHFPAHLCPLAPAAKYIYVARHPVSCFASCVDFIRANLGAYTPDLDGIRAWFCSDMDMWWGSWPQHVDGWWRLAEERPNVLFVRFEDMKRDLEAVVRDVGDFLEIAELAPEEIESIARKCSFDYMRDHADSFEMQPPHLLAIDAELLVSGSADRYRDLPEELRAGVMRWCVERLEGAAYPLVQEYPST